MNIDSISDIILILLEHKCEVGGVLLQGPAAKRLTVMLEEPHDWRSRMERTSAPRNSKGDHY